MLTDHRVIKRIIQPMLGFKSFRSARTTLQGIEPMHRINKGHRVYGNNQNLSGAGQFYYWPPKTNLEWPSCDWRKLTQQNQIHNIPVIIFELDLMICCVIRHTHIVGTFEVGRLKMMSKSALIHRYNYAISAQ
jgi:hypothetical protein